MEPSLAPVSASLWCSEVPLVPAGIFSPRGAFAPNGDRGGSGVPAGCCVQRQHGVERWERARESCQRRARPRQRQATCCSLLAGRPANAPCPRDVALPTSSSREACPSRPCFGSSSSPEACEESCFCQEARLGGEDSSRHGKRGAVCVAVPLCLPFRLFACFQAVKEPPGPAAVVYPSMGRAPGCTGTSCGGAAPRLPLTVPGRDICKRGLWHC